MAIAVTHSMMRYCTNTSGAHDTSTEQCLLCTPHCMRLRKSKDYNWVSGDSHCTARRRTYRTTGSTSRLSATQGLLEARMHVMQARAISVQDVNRCTSQQSPRMPYIHGRAAAATAFHASMAHESSAPPKGKGSIAIFESETAIAPREGKN